jgi:transcriptional repressor NrdR
LTTYEKVEQPTILVIKSNDKREAFNPDKIRIGLIKACEKRPVSAQEIDSIIAGVEKWVYNSLHQEITSHEIGEKVMELLREVDQVAYVRFASVYRQFEDISSFEEALKILKKRS